MMAVVKINDYSNPSAIVVPVSVIRESTTGKYIYLAREENGSVVARRQTVTVGNTYNGMAEITSGLTKGEKVITTGYNSLVEGQLLKISQ
jgi:multidrug efflux pump subunit AcrA (membrane-fusion protein)